MTEEKTKHFGGNGSSNFIKGVETSFTIIESMKEQDLSKVSEIADATGKSKSNVSKHLATLEKHGFVTKGDDGYQLGFRYLDFGGYVRNNVLGNSIIEPKIQELAEETGEIAQFAVQDRGQAVTLYRKSGQKGVATRTRIGRHLPLHQVAYGKAMLAFMPDEKVEEYIDTYGLEPATENTIIDRGELFDELSEVVERNYAINDAESTKGLYAVAAPVTTSDAEVVGACSISGPTRRMKDKNKTDQILDQLLSCVNEIELNLEYS